MEKVGVLIDRLLEQYLNNAPKEQLRVTAQLLLAELDNKTGQNEPDIHSIVSVIFPSLSNLTASDIYTQEPEKPVIKEEKKPEEEEVKLIEEGKKPGYKKPGSCYSNILTN